MKKPLFAIAALATGITMSSTPMTTLAAQIQPVTSGDGYVIYAGQGIECLQQTLEQIWAQLQNNGFICPELPDTQIPDIEIPELPSTQIPDIEIPELPDTQEPDVETPDTDSVHSYVTQVVKLVNEERAKAGLSELTLDMDITAAANVRAVEIKQSFSHTRPDGSSFSTALKEQGVSYRGSGENIAWGQKSPEQVMNAWMNSDGHRANILNSNYKNIGIGYYQDQTGVNYWVQLFTY